jgi:uncharacterized protein YrzB (UPF0473 family)
MANDKNKKNSAPEEEEAMVITLEFDDGVVMETEVIGIFESGGKEYIALAPDDGSDDVYIYGYKESAENEDDFELVDIEDDEEFKAVIATFDELMEEE